MDNDPFFPAPRPKEQPGYREPARALEAGESTSTSASTDSDAPPKAKRTVVKRPDDDLSRYTDGPRIPPITRMDANWSAGLESERSFWNRQSFVRSHPRVFGGVIATLGGGIVCATLASRHHGGTYGALAPLLLCWGIFMLIAGYPRDPHGRMPRWWGVGIFFATLLGAAGGVVLLASLRY